MTIRFLGPLLCGGLLMLAVSTTEASDALPVGGNCSPLKGKFIASTFGAGTTSTAFANIPQSSLTFVLGGASASCVIVRFSAVASAAAPNAIMIRAFLDNTTAALPAEAAFVSTVNSGISGHTFEYILPGVAPGNHTVRMQFRSANGGTVFVLAHNTVVQHAP